MRTSYNTLLPVARWAQIMGISPWEFAGISLVNAGIRDAVACSHLFCQYSWQQDFLSREEIGNCIERAEQMLAEQLNFWPAPKYFAYEKRMYPRPHENWLYGAGGTKRWQMKSLQTQYLKVQTAGIMARTSIGSAALTYQDTNQDNINDKFTLSIPTSVTDPNEIAIYFNQQDRMDNALDETWRIRPVTVSISGGVATVTGHISLCVIPYLEEAPAGDLIDITVSDSFVTSVDVYRVYTDTSYTTTNPAQGIAVWQPFEDDSTSAIGTSPSLPIVVMPTREDDGYVAIDYLLQDSQCTPYPREPDFVYLNYLAGEPLVNGQMAPVMANAVAHLATALLPTDKCGCDRSSRIVHWYRTDPSEYDPGRQLTVREIDMNPFGTARGAVYAWRAIATLKKELVVRL